MNEVQVDKPLIIIEKHKDIFSPSITTCLLVEHIKIEPGNFVCDMGTGTGILGILAHKLGAGKVLFVDRDENALFLAEKNAIKNKCQGYETRKSILFENIDEKFDVILANLPQIPIAQELESIILPKDNGGGVFGNKVVLEFVQQAIDHLHPNGRIYLPIFGISSPDQTLNELDKLYRRETIAGRAIRVDSDPVILKNLPHIFKLELEGRAIFSREHENITFPVVILQLHQKTKNGTIPG